MGKMWGGILGMTSLPAPIPPVLPTLATEEKGLKKDSCLVLRSKLKQASLSALFRLLRMHLSTIHEFFTEIDFKFSLCFVKRNRILNAKSLSMLLVVIFTIGSSHEIICNFSKNRPTGRGLTLEFIERPSITSWLLLLSLLLGSLFAGSGIVARKGELVVPLAVMMLLYTPPVLHLLYSVYKLHVLYPRLLLFFAVGGLLLVLHCVFILLAAKNEIDKEIDEVFSVGKSMEFSETEVGFIRHYS